MHLFAVIFCTTLFLSFLAPLSCCHHPLTSLRPVSSNLKEEDPERLSQRYAPSLARPIALKGKNKQARFSPDGQFILYISRDRREHKNSQVYEMHMPSGEERRLTFQDGENRDPSYHPRGMKVLYASSTDELKEQSWRSILKGVDSPLLSESLVSYEIYLSYRNGTQIQRLTKSPSLDANASFHPSGKFFLFSTMRTGQLDIFMMDIEGGGVSRVLREPAGSSPSKGAQTKILDQIVGKTSYVDDEARFSWDGGSMIWVRYSNTMEESQIYMAKVLGDLKGGVGGVKRLTSKRAKYRSPVWHPNNKHVIFSSNGASPDNYELYVMRRDGSCVNRLTYALGDDLDPEVSPDGKKIIFTRYKHKYEDEQIYIMTFLEPKTCPESL